MTARLETIHPAIRTQSSLASANEYRRHLDIPRATARIGVVFAVVALLAAGAGMFGVLSHAVARRRREFGIRTALGASPAQMGRHVVRDALGLVAAGVGIGAVGGVLVGRSLAALQYGVTASDPLSWVVVLAVLVITALSASWRPAQRAMRADPVVLLRQDQEA